MRRLAQRSLLGATVGVLAIVGVAQPAQAAPPKATPAQHCVVVVDPVKKGETYSRVVSRTCATTEAAAKQALGSLAPSYTIIKFRQHPYWGGDTLTFYGSFPCYDGYLYTFYNTRPSANGAGNWGISSWTTHNGCNHTKIFYDYNLSGVGREYTNDTSEATVPGALNDHVWSAWTTED